MKSVNEIEDPSKEKYEEIKKELQSELDQAPDKEKYLSTLIEEAYGGRSKSNNDYR